MNVQKLCLFLLIFVISLNVSAQEEKRFKIHTLAFYNLENLFDTINNPDKFDEASPIMELKAGREEVYVKKVQNMARVVADIGSELSNNSPALIGISEVENRQVIEDLINNPLLRSKDYGIIHFESPDARGIDVALLYQKALFKPMHKSSHELKIYDDNTKKRVYTRDQLLVSGKLEGDLIHVIVNHWPSRSGGEARSRPKRMAAANLTKRLIDSLQINDPYAKVFIMGDFNDDPTNSSIKDVLKAQSNRNSIKMKGIYNPMENFIKKGIGSNAYRDNWSLFDQIMVTDPLLEKDYSSFRYYKAGVFNKNYLTNKRGRWKGYPFRSFADGGFSGGFSDHFPVYVYVIREVQDESIEE